MYKNPVVRHAREPQNQEKKKKKTDTRIKTQNITEKPTGITKPLLPPRHTVSLVLEGPRNTFISSISPDLPERRFVAPTGQPYHGGEGGREDGRDEMEGGQWKVEK